MSLDPSAREILRATDLHKAYGHLEVLKGITLGVRQGEVLVLIGRSGSGKSTFLRCVNLLEVPSRVSWSSRTGASRSRAGGASREPRSGSSGAASAWSSSSSTCGLT